MFLLKDSYFSRGKGEKQLFSFLLGNSLPLRFLAPLSLPCPILYIGSTDPCLPQLRAEREEVKFIAGCPLLLVTVHQSFTEGGGRGEGGGGAPPAPAQLSELSDGQMQSRS